MRDAVSVIIPAFNAADRIARAVESALAQTHPPLEIIVIDDGSVDRTAEVVQRMAAPVRLLNKDNGGPATARNLGAHHANGNWLAFLDADDWWYAPKLEQQLKHGADSRVGMIHCLPDDRDEKVPERVTLELMWERNWIINSSVMIRRTTFEELGGFNEARELISVEDYNLWLRVAASRWWIRTCPEALVHYTRGIGISSNPERFMRASLSNIANIGEVLGLEPDMIQDKRDQVTFAFGQHALFSREMKTARSLFWKSFVGRPTLRHGLYFAAACLPRRILDVRRKVADW